MVILYFYHSYIYWLAFYKEELLLSLNYLLIYIRKYSWSSFVYSMLKSVTITIYFDAQIVLFGQWESL